MADRGADDEEMENVIAVDCRWRRRGDGGLGQGLAKRRTRGAPGVVGLVQPGQLDPENRGLQGVQAVGCRRHLVIVASQLPVGAQFANPVGELGI